MKVTQVSIQPTDAAKNAGRPSLTPELLAASGARYSRNNEGLNSILSRIDPDNMDKSVDSIFRLIDYGHQSIADMAPVAMFIDDISLWLAYHVWTVCPTAGGQESSTRYIELSPDSLIDADVLGIPSELKTDWKNSMTEAFDIYRRSLDAWESIGEAMPEMTSIPVDLLSEESSRAQKAVSRMKRNYKFDRARYYLPVAASTNMMLVMSARGWAYLCAYLCSHYVLEARMLGEIIRSELALVTPRLIKHAAKKTDMEKGLSREFAQLQAAAQQLPENLQTDAEKSEAPPTALMLTATVTPESHQKFASDLKFHDNRYAWMGEELKRSSVRFSWAAMALAEIRDLNRHRTGNKYCPLRPLGFYSALDQLPEKTELVSAEVDSIVSSDAFGRSISAKAHELLSTGDTSHVYWTLLGTQYFFEQLTTADKFIYEAELRTGLGAHFKYASHMKEALSLWYDRYPETKGLILEGDAEPE